MDLNRHDLAESTTDFGAIIMTFSVTVCDIFWTGVVLRRIVNGHQLERRRQNFRIIDKSSLAATLNATIFQKSIKLRGACFV